MSPYALIAVAQTAATQSPNDGNPVLGFLVLCGIVWGLYQLMKPKKKQYQVEHQTTVRRVK